MKPHFMMFAAYNRWANDRIYEAAADLTPQEFGADTGVFFGSVMRTLNHILVADRIWMRRFTGEGDAQSALDAVLFQDFGGLRDARRAEDARLIIWVSQLTEKALAGRFTYTTVTDMRTVSQRLAPALAHLFNHQTHHRGQVHAALTTLGKPSVTLDMIYFQRTPDGKDYA